MRFRKLRALLLGGYQRAVLVGIAAFLAYILGIETVSTVVALPRNAHLLAGLVGGLVAGGLSTWRYTEGPIVGLRAVSLAFVAFTLFETLEFLVENFLASGELFLYWSAFQSVLFSTLVFPVHLLGAVAGGAIGSYIRKSYLGADVSTGATISRN